MNEMGRPDRPELPSCGALSCANLPQHHAIAVHVHLLSAARLPQEHLHASLASVSYLCTAQMQQSTGVCTRLKRQETLGLKYTMTDGSAKPHGVLYK